MAMQAYLKIEGIGDGAGGQETIEISSFQWGVGRSTTTGTGGGGAGKENFNEITITKKPDEASPLLLAACTNGGHFSIADIYVLLPAVQGNGAQEFYKYQFTGVAISEFETGGNFGGAPVPVESMKFEFEQVAIFLPAVQ